MDKRNTIQKQLTLDAVRQLKSHAGADEVYDYVSKQHPSISKATVYRNLNLLSESGEIKKIEVPGGMAHFDHQCHRHYHAKCIECGKIFDINADLSEEIIKRVSSDNDFEIKDCDIFFKGICSACQKNMV